MEGFSRTNVTVSLLSCQHVCVRVCTGEASSQSISSQILFLIGWERHMRASDARGDAADLLRLTQPPPKNLAECEIDPGALR